MGLSAVIKRKLSLVTSGSSAESSCVSMQPTHQYDHLFRVVMVGDSGVGKSALVQRFTEGMFTGRFMCTIGVDFRIKTVKLDGVCVKAQMWDTGGQERYRCISSAYYRGADGIVLVYDVTKEESFENTRLWLQAIWTHAREDTSILLVGNKCDRVRQRQVAYARGEAFAKRWGMQFVEMSAKGDTNVDEAFTSLLAIIKDRATSKKTTDALSVSENKITLLETHHPDTNSCC